MRISDCSSYVCSSDLHRTVRKGTLVKLLYFAWLKTRTGMAEEEVTPPEGVATVGELLSWLEGRGPNFAAAFSDRRAIRVAVNQAYAQPGDPVRAGDGRSEEHTSELQSLMRISYAVICLKKTNTT